jgi:hypothetical protein
MDGCPVIPAYLYGFLIFDDSYRLWPWITALSLTTYGGFIHIAADLNGLVTLGPYFLTGVNTMLR